MMEYFILFIHIGIYTNIRIYKNIYQYEDIDVFNITYRYFHVFVDIQLSEVDGTGTTILRYLHIPVYYSI